MVSCNRRTMIYRQQECLPTLGQSRCTVLASKLIASLLCRVMLPLCRADFGGIFCIATWLVPCCFLSIGRGLLCIARNFPYSNCERWRDVFQGCLVSVLSPSHASSQDSCSSISANMHGSFLSAPISDVREFLPCASRSSVFALLFAMVFVPRCLTYHNERTYATHI